MRRPAADDLQLADMVLTAAELEGAERDAYIEQLEGTAPELAAEVRRRLDAAQDLAGSFLATPAVDRLGDDLGAQGNGMEPSAAPMIAEARYELAEELGRGGMGRVVKAHDRQLGRTVALKFLNHDDPEVLRLFLDEARHQARLRHDHVLGIYDSGLLDGQPFISMQYADQGTLSEIAAELPLEGKVRLLYQAAEGLHAAHRQGLLHRDVKPSNILVERTEDGDLRALVTDFGLATELDPDDPTIDDAVAGSPQFIAPERLLGSAPSDRRSDVYSLGITVFRLLTGHLPFEGPATVHVLRQAVTEELPRPRHVEPDLPAELEAVILRAAARRPEERYASARAVADDLRRYLDGEMVEAYAAGLAYRVTRFVLRNRVLTGLAAALVLVLAVTSLAVTVFALRADAARQRAELRHGQAEELIEFMVVDLRAQLAALGRLDILSDLGSAAMEYFEAVPDDELSETELLRRSRMLYQIGEVRVRQGNLTGAREPFEESLELAHRLTQLSPEDGERLFELGQAHFWVGYVSWEQGDLAAARGPFEDYLEVSQRLVTMDPLRPDWRQELSYAHSNLGSLLQAEGNLEAALEQFLTTLSIDQDLVAADPKRGTRSELAATHNTVGTVLRELGRSRESAQHLHAELEIRQTLVDEDPKDPHTRDFLGASHGQLGSYYAQTGDRPTATEHFRAQKDIFNELVKHDPANMNWQLRRALSYLSLSYSALEAGDVQASAASLDIACRQVDAFLARDDTASRWHRANAMCLFQRARLGLGQSAPAAHQTLLRAIEIFEGLADAQSESREIHRWLSRSLLLLGRYEDDLSAANDAFERAEVTIAPFAQKSREVGAVTLWARALRCLGRAEEARTAWERIEAETGSGLTDQDHCPWLEETTL